MDVPQMIVCCILLVAAAVLITIKVIRARQSGEEITLNSFLAQYSDVIINCLKSSVAILELNMSQFNTKTEYYQAIIKQAINAIKDQFVQLGFPIKLFELFDMEALSNYLAKILEEQKIDIFSVLAPEDLTNHSALFDAEVYNALAGAIENEGVDEEEESPVVDPDDPADGTEDEIPTDVPAEAIKPAE